MRRAAVPGAPSSTTIHPILHVHTILPSYLSLLGNAAAYRGKGKEENMAFFLSSSQLFYEDPAFTNKIESDSDSDAQNAAFCKIGF
jgi:hypothetical protein